MFCFGPNRWNVFNPDFFAGFVSIVRCFGTADFRAEVFSGDRILLTPLFDSSCPASSAGA
jgi:hypothetical protein